MERQRRKDKGVLCYSEALCQVTAFVTSMHQANMPV